MRFRVACKPGLLALWFRTWELDNELTNGCNNFPGYALVGDAKNGQDMLKHFHNIIHRGMLPALANYNLREKTKQ